MNVKRIIGLIALVLVAGSAAWAQSRDTGAINGQVRDEQGNPLPGVAVVLSSPNLMGSRSSVTDSDGRYRFPALPPGEYSLKYELQGFSPVGRESVRVNTTVTLTLDVAMKPTAVSEEITVQAQVPTIDVKSSETASITLSNEILRNIPNTQFTADIVNLAPGVNDNVAYGASQNTGIAYTMDGVNVADPEAGSAWVFSDYNAIEEAKVMGIGLPAEYGNFTGVIFNLVTKSGGNAFAGHFETIFQGAKTDGKFWQANNNQAYLADFPSLSSPSAALFDVNGHLGGPIVKDRLWFYTGVQFYRSMNRPTGFPEDVTYKQPRWFGKITSQISATLNFNASLQIDTYNGTNRGAASWVEPEATVTQKSPEIVGNFSLTKILSPKTFFDLKGAYFWGYYYLEPEVGRAAYAHIDQFDFGYQRHYSSGYFYLADRTRVQANASLTHYVEKFIAGSHDFKFGAEIERSSVRNRYGYTGQGGALGPAVKYADSYYEPFAPYYAYQYAGYDTDCKYTRFEGFAQDSWQATSRLNINVGLRFSANWGQVKNVPGNVWTSTRLAPRLGFTFDLLGDKSTIVKGHFGQFTEAMLTAFFTDMNAPSAYSPWIMYWWNGDAFEEVYRVNRDTYTMDPNIKHPYMQQMTFGIERELFRDTSLGITYIHRDWKNSLVAIDTAGQYTPVDVHVPGLDQTFTVWERTDDTLESYNYVITNPKKGSPTPYITLEPYRKYDGIEVLLNKRFSNRWQVLASYVYGVAKGTIDNGFGGDIGWGGNMYDPNFWINADGNSTSDPTHMIKVQATYVIPWFDVQVNAYYRGITGDAWARQSRVRLNQGRVTFFSEPRGSHHYPMQHDLDMRLEKLFTLGRYRVGLMFDVFNVFNSHAITNWGTTLGVDWNPGTLPSTSGHNYPSIQRPRQARLGVRLIF